MSYDFRLDNSPPERPNDVEVKTTIDHRWPSTMGKIHTAQ